MVVDSIMDILTDDSSSIGHVAAPSVATTVLVRGSNSRIHGYQHVSKQKLPVSVHDEGQHILSLARYGLAGWLAGVTLLSASVCIVHSLPLQLTSSATIHCLPPTLKSPVIVCSSNMVLI